MQRGSGLLFVPEYLQTHSYVRKTLTFRNEYINYDDNSNNDHTGVTAVSCRQQ